MVRFTDSPIASVVVCTRNRGEKVAATLDSILRNEGSFELLVVDQSDDRRTHDVVMQRRDSRLRYLATGTRGLSNARNIGLREAASDIVLMTDDDCEVPSDWVSRMTGAFGDEPSRAVVFCDVLVGPFDAATGFIPGSRVATQVFTSFAHALNRLGMGAGFAVRKSAAVETGGFDPRLGAGADFHSGEEHDLAYRLLLSGYQAACTQDTHVVHHGFRTFAEGRALIRGYALGHAAIFGKLARCGHAAEALCAYGSVLRVHALRPLLLALARGQGPFGFHRLASFINGFARGLVTAVDARTKTFVAAPENPRAAIVAPTKM
jgi:glycosyltransferase involved in cell wall biosynthesis